MTPTKGAPEDVRSVHVMDVQSVFHYPKNENREWVIVVKCQMRNSSAISWR
jgi:hypothetical protein